MKWNDIAKANLLFLCCVGGLIAVGMATLWWIPPPPGREGQPPPPEHYYFYKQIVWLGISTAAAVFLLIPHYLRVRAWAYPAFALSLIVLAGILLFARSVKGSQRWIYISGFSIQPSEFAKIAAVLALAHYLMYRDSTKTLTGLIGPFLLAACPMVLVLIQPDLGSAMLFFPALLAMVFAAGARRKHLASILGAVAVFVPISFFLLLKDYQQQRITSFLWPARDALGGSYQQLLSIASVAIGGLSGSGWGAGVEGYALSVPEHQTDFIFSVIAEEWGLVGTTALLALYLGYILGGLWLAYRTREPFGRLLVVGIVTIHAAQAAINIGMNIGIAPITGITLPFVSYGGSSLLSSFIALALILNVNARWVPSLGTREFAGDEGQIPDVGVKSWERRKNPEERRS